MKNPPDQKRSDKAKPVDAKLSACRICTSTDRTPYHDTVEHEIAGVHDEYGPYTHIVLRRTECENCGQHRIDRTYENRVSRGSDSAN